MNTPPRVTSKYAICIDFGTESGRAVLVEVATGRDLASSVHPYANGVIDETLPGTTIALEPDWALQDPNDYLEVFKTAIPAVLRHAPDHGGRHAALFLARVAQYAARLGQVVEAPCRAARSQPAQSDRPRARIHLPGPLRGQDQFRM